MMHLDSPIFDIVRIAPRVDPDDVMQRYCEEHGVERQDFICGRYSRFPKDRAPARMAFIVHCRDAGVPPIFIARFIGHVDARTVRGWLAQYDVEAGQ